MPHFTARRASGYQTPQVVVHDLRRTTGVMHQPLTWSIRRYRETEYYVA